MQINTKGLIFLSVLIFISSVPYVSSVPPLPAEFYGNVIINGSPAPVGTVITAYIQDTLKGTVTTEYSGVYGGPGIFDPRLKVNVSEAEYQSGNLSIRFFINSNPAHQMLIFEPGTAKQFDLSYNGIPVDTVQPAMTPISTLAVVPTMNAPSSANYYNTPLSEPTQIQGLTSEMRYTSDDGSAEVLLKKGTLLVTPNGEYIKNIIIKSRTINDLSPISDDSMIFSGYSYQIIPERTYFNPNGIFRIRIPSDRIPDLFSMNPQIYQYDIQEAIWNQKRTISNQFTGELSTDINDAAIYALFLNKKPVITQPVVPVLTHVPTLTNQQPYINPSNIYPQQPQSPQFLPTQEPDRAYIQPASYKTDYSVNVTNVTAVAKNETVIKEVQVEKKSETIPNAVNYTETTPIITQDRVESDSSQLKPTFSILSPAITVAFGTGGVILILIILIILANILIYLAYTRWWLKKV